ncbi:hypothetical protein DMN91_001898 [Ooceraea biroi]|uniref:Uncharacterized protein n=2 Tax=Ooceraea biroi TaxID=2015173 RepID=A0A026X492_OOCBI|nr:hypothetical protein X777_02830 [Ooceraea biroi]RLU25740.1 hypothetical protein DMN91_001898 [Ooceraea biroi]
MNQFFMLFYIMMVMWMFYGKCKAAPGFIGIHRNLENYPYVHRYALESLMNDFAEDLVGEDEDNLQLSKRQQLDDYGHMRFGRRSLGDDIGYGHL